MSNKITIEDNQIVVTELLPMSEAPEDKWILSVVRDTKNIYQGVVKENRFWLNKESFVLVSNLSGWIPVPIYKPEE